MQSSSTLPPGWRIPTLDGARSRGIYVQFYDPCGHRYGIPTYPWHWAPKHLYTARQLRARGLRPGGQSPIAQILWRRGLRVEPPKRSDHCGRAEKQAKQCFHHVSPCSFLPCSRPGSNLENTPGLAHTLIPHV